MTNELREVIPSILAEATNEIRVWLTDAECYGMYSPEQRQRLEVLVAQMDLLRSELAQMNLPQTSAAKPRIGAYCGGCQHQYANCTCPAGKSMARAA